MVSAEVKCNIYRIKEIKVIDIKWVVIHRKYLLVERKRRFCNKNAVCGSFT